MMRYGRYEKDVFVTPVVEHVAGQPCNKPNCLLPVIGLPENNQVSLTCDRATWQQTTNNDRNEKTRRTAIGTTPPASQISVKDSTGK